MEKIKSVVSPHYFPWSTLFSLEMLQNCLWLNVTYLLLPPKSNMLTRKPLYFVDSFENPTVGATMSSDSPTKDLAVQVFPVLSKPNIRIQILRSRTFTVFLPIKWLQHIEPSVIICIILRWQYIFPRRTAILQNALNVFCEQRSPKKLLAQLY